ncbi:MAG TPA: glycosyltransferase family 2 protein [Rudaea sp.]|nr:glycosyltransferase family 2 protein [Rudaea sp.]
MALAVFAWLCTAIACGGLAVQLRNLRFYPRLRPRTLPGRSIVACVAMRNEEENARACIDGLSAQPEIGAILVCDDGSCDRTLPVLMECAERDTRIVVVSLPDSKDGSKSAALAVAGTYAASLPYRYLLFTDADVRLERGAAGALLERLHEVEATALTAWPRVRGGTLADVLLAPLVTLLLLQALPMWRSRDGDPRFVAGNGQIFLVEAHAYHRCGGHAAIDDTVEDVALARNLARCGYAVAFASAASIAGTRGYGSLRAAIGSLGRSLYGGGGIAACAAFALWQATAFALPYVLLPFVPAIAAGAVAAGIVARVVLALRMRESPAGVVLAPAAAAIATAGALGIAVAGARGRLTWRGRTIRR